MRFGLIVVGDEILSGKRADKHVPQVIEMLSKRGLALAWVRFVGDDPALITADLRHAFSCGDVVFCCGGIGATPDDHTRQCAAAALGLPLVLHPKARELIVQRMQEMAAERGVPYEPARAESAHRLNMGLFPEGAQVVPNPYNKIPGFSVGQVFFVPGFPVMAWPMIEWVLDQRLARLHGTGAQCEKSVIVFEMMESTLTPLMESIEARFSGVKVFSLPSVDHPQWGRHIELGVKGETSLVGPAYLEMLAGLAQHNASLGPELER